MKNLIMLIAVGVFLVACAATKVSVLEMENLNSVNLPNGFQKGTDVKGELIILDGITNLNVIAILPPEKGNGIIEIPLEGKYDRFEATAISLGGDVVLSIIGDNKKLSVHPKLSKKDKPVELSVDITDMDMLKIAVDSYGYVPGDNLILLNPILIK